jgi:hypothetical protein
LPAEVAAGIVTVVWNDPVDPEVTVPSVTGVVLVAVVVLVVVAAWWATAEATIVVVVVPAVVEVVAVALPSVLCSWIWRAVDAGKPLPLTATPCPAATLLAPS